MASIAPYGIYQAFDDNGDPLSGGFLFTYEAGTDTPKATYTNADGNVENSNPVELDASGQAQVWLGDGGYKFVLKDADDVTLWTTDDINGTSSSAFGGVVNAISTNTAITSVYANSVNICTSSPTLSLLPASTAGEGFYFSVKNQGSGTVTIDPDGGETIDGAATKTVGPSQSALIITNGSTWYTLFFADITASGNNVFTGTNTFTGIVGVNGTSSTSGGISFAEDTDNGTNKVTYKAPATISADTTFVLPAADGSAGYVVTTDGAGTLTLQADPFVAGLKNQILNGLRLSNNVSDATNDIDIAAGACVSDDGTTVMTLAAAYTKQLDVAWAVGANQGMLDTGVIADTTYHIWVINRPDTNVTDVLASTSASSPTLPANYTKKKRIGSIIRASSAILPFIQYSKEFWLKTPVQFINTTSSITAALVAATVPAGIKVMARIAANMDASTVGAVYFSDPDAADVACAVSTGVLSIASGQQGGGAQVIVGTNTSSQIRWRSSVASRDVDAATLGWVDYQI